MLGAKGDDCRRLVFKPRAASVTVAGPFGEFDNLADFSAHPSTDLCRDPLDSSYQDCIQGMNIPRGHRASSMPDQRTNRKFG